MTVVLTLEQAVHDLGYKSVNDYAKAKLQEEFRLEIVQKKSEISAFEQKYKMGFKEFKRVFFELNQFGLFEKEDDSMDWEFAIEVVKLYEEKLSALS